MEREGNKFGGIIPAVITPFTREGRLDEDALRSTLRFLIKSGVHGLMVNGSTGEAASLSPEERRTIVETAASEAGGKLPVIAGTGAPNTRVTTELTKDAKEAGADAAMIVTPFYLIPNERGLIKHYRSIAKNVDIPIVLYNIPQHTKVNLEPSLIAKLCEEIPNIAALKDSYGSLGQFAQTIGLVGNKISVLTGCDDLLFPSFVLGARGAIVAIGNIAPSMVVDLFSLVQRGNIKRARDVYFKLLPIARAIGSEFNFPAPVKEAIRLLGRPTGPTRSPIVVMTKEEKKSIKEALAHAGLL